MYAVLPLFCVARRYLQQSSKFSLTPWVRSRMRVSPAMNASPMITGYAQMHAYLEQRVLESSTKGLVLRYDLFNGPNTRYHLDCGAADEVRGGVWLLGFAWVVGAPPPPFTIAEQARQMAGEDAVYYRMRLSAGSMQRRRETLISPRGDWSVSNQVTHGG
jgi:hypothetical protein